MAHTIAINLFIIFFIVFVAKPTFSCHWTKGYTISIFDSILANQDKVRFHCASKNDDLGNHTFYRGFSYDWSFCDSILKNTLFFCHFWWGSKQKAFVVLDYKLGKIQCKTGTCRWFVADNGFYLSDGIYGTNTPVKKYDWQ
ncbi:hypothetical protein PHJA_002412300 [Phtheirospermum japonicum]|uniref:S-protein homolog n=1 Tax=Phtheirospermum japonicum TaxID=374723 RepID=A0A830D389_9LAMI|nr:hypothetical protein PHJA_002412300 [Phtheirospermum japonicum]